MNNNDIQEMIGAMVDVVEDWLERKPSCSRCAASCLIVNESITALLRFLVKEGYRPGILHIS